MVGMIKAAYDWAIIQPADRQCRRPIISVISSQFLLTRASIKKPQ